MPVENISGVRNFFGPRTTETKSPSTLNTRGRTRELIVPIVFNDLPAANALDNTVLTIPAGAVIRSAILKVKVPFAGGTSYDIGTVRPDGTGGVADGLFNDLLLAAIDTVGEVATANGTSVGASVGANPVQIRAVATGTFTAGVADLVVEYQV